MESKERSGFAAVAPRDATAQAAKSIPAPSAAVHLTLAICCSLLLVFCLAAAPRGTRQDAGQLFLGALLLAAILQLPAVYWQHRGSAERRDAALMLPWAVLLAVLMAQMARTASTLTFPLCDALWRSFDEHLGINVPAMMAWAARHSMVHTVLTDSYALSEPFLIMAIFLPPLLGKREASERFFVTNAIGFVIALPIVALFPAVGPWVGWQFQPDSMQRICEASIHTLRQGTVHGALFGGTICLPSFHTFWAVVSAHAMQPFRLLRYPAIVLAVLIMISTMTTGWHYGVDVITGFLLAVISTAIATAIVSKRRGPAGG